MPMNHALNLRHGRTLGAAVALLTAVLTLTTCGQEPVVTMTTTMVSTDAST